MASAAIIYIRADGSIDPSDAPISRSGNTYTFIADADNVTVEVQADNIIVDGDGHRLKNADLSLNNGISSMFRLNDTVKNLIIQGYTNGICLFQCSRCDIIRTNETHCGYGISVQDSDDVFISSNVMTDCETGLSLYESNNNFLGNNEVSNSSTGIDLTFSHGNTLRNNRMISNQYNFNLIALGHYAPMCMYINDVDPSNAVDGKPIYYVINRSSEIVPSLVGCIVIVNSTGITVKDLRLRNNGCEVILAFTSNSIVENVSATTSLTGILLDRCDQTMAKHNNVSYDFYAGITTYEARYAIITQNTVDHTSHGCGIWIEDSNFVSVRDNVVTYTSAGGGQEFDGCGVLIDDSCDCNVTKNTIAYNLIGITFGAPDAQRNRIAGNTIMVNDVGFIICGQSNIICHNNVVANNISAERMWFTCSNNLDLGVYGGNYWGYYSGIDHNHDGIGDTSYLIDSLNIDHYPLMSMWREWDVNCDGRISVLDLIKIANSLGQHPDSSQWNPNADANEDNTLNVLDLILISTHMD
jgi:parallel beta-helix repeat protein